MTAFKKILCVCVMAAVLVMTFPVSSLAVDPVSAATMANALAQAITAYGASQGVSMAFDVTNTDGIGEGVHDLWDQFKTEINDPDTPTYDSLAVTMWSNLYSKVGDKLAINISASVMPFIDSFWNWLLLGPAEMTKVDNQYYEWNVNQQTGEVNPILIYSVGPIPHQPIPAGVTTSNINTGYHYATWNNNTELNIGTSTNDGYVFIYGSDSTNILICSPVSGTNFVYETKSNTIISHQANTLYSVNNVQFYYYSQSLSAITSIYCPTFTDRSTALDYFASVLSGNVSSDDLYLQPYVGDTAPQNVYIPDNTDVNYNPIDSTIKLNIPWDNTTFGDGNGTLTDAQSTAATNATSSAITNSMEKTLILDDTANPDIPANEVYIPLLPVEIPSFNFSLSGIWYYVVSWVQSLGAWLSLVFQTWAVLPSAITIPVYATAVIVIVLGIYKRFFM